MNEGKSKGKEGSDEGQRGLLHKNSEAPAVF